ncbi:HET-domain-containing protein, partial [Sporormia fimetaria CBS 119925]
PDRRRDAPLSPQSSNTGSVESFSKVSTWLDRCLTSHTRCNMGNHKAPWLPTRLLEIAATEGAERKPYGIRMIYTTGTNKVRGPYCTLSYCWGNARSIQLTGATEESLLSGVAFEELPKTFADAVTATAILGIRYLWIDSLCIFQDDPSDWAREASLMEKVYSYSQCNICASVAEDSNDGLFRSRNPHIVARVQVDLRLPEGHGASPRRYEMYDSQFLMGSLSSGILGKRGWAYQERLLSPRGLHFGHYQLFWEYRELEASETFPEGLPSMLHEVFGEFTSLKTFDPNVYYESSPKPLQGLSSPQEPSLDDMSLEMWHEIVRRYSATLLTKPEDKLVALSGIAKRIMSIRNDTYLAGLWRRDLESQLSWWISDSLQVDRRPSTRPAPYRAPSWSWASVDGIVRRCPYHSAKLCIEMKDVVVKHATDDPTGQVAGGWLDFCGRLIPVRIIYMASDEGDPSPMQWRLLFDHASPQHQNPANGRNGFKIMLDVPPSADNAFDEDNDQGRLFLVCCCLQTEELRQADALLFRLVDIEKALFERIGLASVDLWIDAFAWYDLNRGRFEDLLFGSPDEEVERRLPCLRYENGLHTIRVI